MELQEKGYLEAKEIFRDNRVVVSKTKDAAVKLESQILGNFNADYVASALMISKLFNICRNAPISL